MFEKINSKQEKTPFQFLWDKLDGKKFWLGIYTEDGGATWKSVNGDVIDSENMFWNRDDGQPDKKANQDKIYSGKNKAALHDIPGDQPFWFVCDKVNN